MVCLEADDLTAGGPGDWSVMVIGVGEVLHGRELVERASRLTLPRWSSARTDHYVRISTDLLSGRRAYPCHP